MSEIPTDGQMTWKLEGATDTALHLRHDPSEPWRPYEEFPEYFLPDPREFSKGYATFLALLKKGWKAV
ncbi:hypothetical protein [Dendronalium sp. ChiSLP03b]|uniref:hypothetical protein n=1 Tax=Dendronalium sp. ChiSLP03b TaxID=3075381 RepID=UPI002AD21516|nr:hypothetical protein [Dendronalium sp. ChiSLP03b]MDZ8205597.1 hypothetical protein [Dendronalium sp. ChiSLP03b]